MLARAVPPTGISPDYGVQMFPGASNRGIINGQESLRRSRPYRRIRTNKHRIDRLPLVRLHHYHHLRRPLYTLKTRRCGGDYHPRHWVSTSSWPNYSFDACSTGLHRRPDRRPDYTTKISLRPRLTDKCHERVGQRRTSHKSSQKIFCSLAKRPGISEVSIA